MTETAWGVSLFVVNRALEQRAYDAVVAAGIADITLAQSRVLARVGPGGTRIGELAEAARVAKQTATHLVGELAANGYVSLAPDPRDRRARLVTLTAKALDVVPIANAEVARVEAEWREHLGAARFEQWCASLGALRDLVDPFDRAPTRR